jgi:hypothetical protein
MPSGIVQFGHRAQSDFTDMENLAAKRLQRRQLPFEYLRIFANHDYHNSGRHPGGGAIEKMVPPGWNPIG